MSGGCAPRTAQPECWYSPAARRARQQIAEGCWSAHVASCTAICQGCGVRDCAHCPGCGACMGEPHSFECPGYTPVSDHAGVADRS